MMITKMKSIQNQFSCTALFVCCLVVISTITICIPLQVSGFHLSFSNRLLKSVSNPQLNPASSLIRPIECRNANNASEVGICMFSIDCMQNKGVPLSVCKHNYFVGTCCRLPDYNNFVGIVYDLRDTEANHVLEVRKSQPEAPNGTTSSYASTMAKLSELPVPTTQSYSQGSQVSRLANTQSAHPAGPLTTTSMVGSVTTSEDETTSSSVDNKYMISSTSLFSGSTQQQPSTEQPVAFGAQPSNKSGGPVGESARNADGGTAAQVTLFGVGQQSHQISELDSFQIQTTLANDAHSNGQSELKLSNVKQPTNNAYELIKDDSLEVVSTINSAHLAPQTVTTNNQHHQHQLQQQFNMIEHADSPAVEQSSLLADRSSIPHHQSNVYQLDDQQAKQQQSIVFANNHQPTTVPAYRPTESTGSSSSASQQPTPLTTLRSSTQQQASQVNDQEFTLSTVTASGQVQELRSSPAESSSSSTSASPANEQTGGSVAPTTVTVGSSSQAGGQSSESSTSSPLVDLVSSSNSTQTTTPFTTSLSTALLPNVSSHPYSPTPAPPPQNNNSQQQLSSLVPTKSSSTTSSAHKPLLPSSNQSASTSQQPSTTTTTQSTELPSSAGFSQLYSNQHANPTGTTAQETAPMSSAAAAAAGHQHQSNRPNILHLGSPALQAATKIVTGGSSANNLIPGLSGLQSAILSHIPFKIPAGLSSGLSSYLQAAMKPTGNRPLLSSNTAPSQMYQQQMMASSNVTKLTPLTLAGNSAIRFPSPSASTQPPTDLNMSQPTSQSANVVSWSSAAMPSTQVPFLRDVVKEAQQVCGRPQVSHPAGENAKKRVARIVGGNQSLFGQWPWMVSLRQWRKGAFLHKCGAALLNENWAITAAHCVENVKASDLLLRLGEFDVSNQDEPYPFIERRVKTVVAHPSFDPKTFEYDLALLRFAEPIKYERNIVPVCVPAGNDSYVDRMATVIGWGRLYEDGPLPDVIQHVDVPIITNNECEKMYKNAGYVEEIPEMFICAGISKGGRDSCEGDSGGPLTMVDHDGRSYLVGIISWGIGCALPSQPGVYTRITAFSGWINQITAF